MGTTLTQYMFQIVTSWRNFRMSLTHFGLSLQWQNFCNLNFGSYCPTEKYDHLKFPGGHQQSKSKTNVFASLHVLGVKCNQALKCKSSRQFGPRTWL